MHSEVSVAIEFIQSYLFNKLPRRRVMIFGEELEKVLKEKFMNHWYPNEPEKGSGYRCIKVGNLTDPPDTILTKTAQACGVEIQDIIENLPSELTIWIDPKEVSYKTGDRGTVHILYSEKCSPDSSPDGRESFTSFNPEARIFNPINRYPTSISPDSFVPASPPLFNMNGHGHGHGHRSSAINSNSFIPKTSPQEKTFTIGDFAQTKFGSTKLKTNKRPNGLSPTENSKIKAQMQLQQQATSPLPQIQKPHPIAPISPPGRSFSPQVRAFNGDGGFFGGPNAYPTYNGRSAAAGMNGSISSLTESLNNVSIGGNSNSPSNFDFFSKFPSLMDDSPYQLFNQTWNNNSSSVSPPISSPPSTGRQSQENSYFDGFNFNTATNSAANSTCSASSYQQLLLAN